MKEKIIDILPRFILLFIIKLNFIIHPIYFIKTIIKINKALIDKNWKRNLIKLSFYGLRYKDFIEYFLQEELKIVSKNCVFNNNKPILICIVKDDLIRIKLLLNHYRKIGVCNFAILDDKSSDGTFEYLSNQDDVILFSSSNSYSTVRRQVWINKIIHTFGYNKWYIIVDSDELLYYDDCLNVKIDTYLSELRKKNVGRVKALLLDLFSKDTLYDDRVKNEFDIEKYYKYFYNSYYTRKIIYDYIYQGGARALFFFNKNSKYLPFVSKYPLIYVKSDDIILNSHYNFPFSRNINCKPMGILKHFKFLPSDVHRYNERQKNSGFFNSGTEYKKYSSVDKDILDDKFKMLEEYVDINSIDNSKL